MSIALCTLLGSAGCGRVGFDVLDQSGDGGPADDGATDGSVEGGLDGGGDGGGKPSEMVLVTTAADEATAGATPSAPGGEGLSLREAVAYAAAADGRQTIQVPSGMTITLSTGAIEVHGSDIEIAGDGATVVGAASGACIDVMGDENLLAGLELTGCAAQPIRIAGTGNTVTRVHAHDNGDGVQVLASGNTIGPGNEIDNNTTHGLDVFGTTTIVGNSIHHNTASGMFLNMAADGTTVVGNFVFANLEHAVTLGAGLTDPVIVHNTLDSNEFGGLLCSSDMIGLTFRNNIVARNQGWGLDDCTDASFAVLSHVDFHENTLGDCAGCSTLGAGELSVDPAYVDPGELDLRLSPSSPLIDAAVDLGYDRNGESPGLFDGTAPDIGADEAQ